MYKFGKKIRITNEIRIPHTGYTESLAGSSPNTKKIPKKTETNKRQKLTKMDSNKEKQAETGSLYLTV